jgi:hypothetical protein
MSHLPQMVATLHGLPATLGPSHPLIDSPLLSREIPPGLPHHALSSAAKLNLQDFIIVRTLGRGAYLIHHRSVDHHLPKKIDRSRSATQALAAQSSLFCLHSTQVATSI